MSAGGLRPFRIQLDRHLSFRPEHAESPQTSLAGEALGCEGVYVCATGHPLLSQNASHAWFEVDGLIVGITHDQFHGIELNGWDFAPEEGWYTLFEEQDRRDGYSPPCEWLIYPSDGYDVACNEVVAQGITVADLQSY